jgi:hypothetical protein
MEGKDREIGSSRTDSSGHEVETLKVGGKYATAISHDGVHTFALSVAMKKTDNSTTTVDGGGTSFRAMTEVTEYQKALLAEGFAVQVTQYPSNHSQHAKDDALALAGTL